MTSTIMSVITNAFAGVIATGAWRSGGTGPVATAPSPVAWTQAGQASFGVAWNTVFPFASVTRSTAYGVTR